jgi:hypothetical protein
LRTCIPFMFTIDTNITDLKIRERDLFKVLFSMNIHQVATPELSAEDAKSYVFFFREGGRFLSYIGLHFLRTDRKLYYSHSENPIAERELSAVESEARSFAENMGAMLDELDLAKMSDMEKDRWIDEQGIFSSGKKEEEKAEEPAAAGIDQPQPAAQPVPVAQPAPVAQPVPAPAVQSAPAEKAAPVPPAPASQPAPVLQTETPVAPVMQPLQGAPPAPAEQSQVRAPAQPPAPPRPQRKQAAPARQPADRTKSAVPVSETKPSVDDVLGQAVKDGIVKAPKQPLKKDIRSSAGAVSRDKEALARLLASF